MLWGGYCDLGKRGRGGGKDSGAAARDGGKSSSQDAAPHGGRSLQDTVQKVADSLERAKLGEYVELMSRPGRLIYLNLLGGLFRGMGMAVGFTILGALVIYVLTRSFISSLPIVGDFLGELVWIIQQYLKGKS